MIIIAYQKEEQQKWLRTLDYLQQENIFLKNQLANIIKNDISSVSLEKAEYFQNEFLNKDAVIALIRYDIAKQSKATTNLDPEAERKTAKRHEKLRSDIEKMEKEFNRLKHDFSTYIAKGL